MCLINYVQIPLVKQILKFPNTFKHYMNEGIEWTLYLIHVTDEDILALVN